MKPEQWLRECPFGEWLTFDSIPDGIFCDVFELIDGAFLGWCYIFNDDDTMFKKTLAPTPNNYSISQFKHSQRCKFDDEMFTRSNPG
jgi:hypothetical protein